MHFYSFLLVLAAARAASALVQDTTATVLPRSPPRDLRSVKMARRQMSTTQCGDGAGNALDISALVQDAVQSGLPSASETGVLFMRVSVPSAELCGPYACFVSPDATGSEWINMNILTDVPSIATGQCRASPERKEYSLVAQIPSQTNCSGPGGACLVMCKNEVQTQGSCAAISFGSSGNGQAASSNVSPSRGNSQAASPAPQAESSTTSVVTPDVLTNVITSSIDVTRETTYTQVVIQPVSLPSSSSVSSSSTSSAITRGAPTIVGFSGENSPGGYADQFGGPGNPVVLGSHAGVTQSVSEQESAASKDYVMARITTVLAVVGMGVSLW